MLLIHSSFFRVLITLITATEGKRFSFCSTTSSSSKTPLRSSQRLIDRQGVHRTCTPPLHARVITNLIWDIRPNYSLPGFDRNKCLTLVYFVVFVVAENSRDLYRFVSDFRSEVAETCMRNGDSQISSICPYVLDFRKLELSFRSPISAPRIGRRPKIISRRHIWKLSREMQRIIDIGRIGTLNTLSLIYLHRALSTSDRNKCRIRDQLKKREFKIFSRLQN